MKKSIRTLIFLLLLDSVGCQTDEECQQLPCARPNINDIIELTLFFQNSQAGEQVELVRINKADQTAIDTLAFELTANREIIIGNGGTVGFSEPTTGDAIEEATLDFKVLLSDEQTIEITSIEIERFLTQDECGCADYQISTLKLDGQTVEINSKSFTLNL